MYRFPEFMMDIEKSHINNSRETVELSKAWRNYCPSRSYPIRPSLIGIEASLVIFSGPPSLLFLFFFSSVFLWRRRISILVRISISKFLFLSRSKQNKKEGVQEKWRLKASRGWRIQWTFYRQSSCEISEISDSGEFFSLFPPFSFLFF